MKTIHKMIIPVLLTAGTALLAQEKKSKVCITIDENRNGKVTRVDTCFESADPKEVESFLKNMGMEDQISVSGKGEKKIVILNKEAKDGSKNEYNYSYATDGDSPEVMTLIVEDDGKITTTGTGNAKVIVKQFNGNEEDIDKEIGAALKEVEKDNKGGKIHKKEIKVIVARKVMISDVSNEDKKMLPSDLQQVKGKSFEALNVFPNPSKGSFSVSYKGNTEEPLTVELYDALGGKVLVEKGISTDKEITKNINVSHLTKGVYFMHITQGTKAEVKKVVIAE